MKGFIETTYNNVEFRVKEGYLYSGDDLWADIADETATVGLSEFLQKSKGDVSFIEIVLKNGEPVKRGQKLGKVETMKATFDIIVPVTGKILEVNSELEGSPYPVNSDPYGEGWLFKIKLTDADSDKGRLLRAESYMKTMKEKLKKN